MDNWEALTLGEFAPFKYGKALPENTRNAGDIPVVSSAGVTGSHNKSAVHGPGIVIGRKGTVGSVTLVKTPFWPIDTAFYVEDVPEKRDLNYTYFLLQTLKLREKNSDSAVPGLNRDAAHSILLKVPDIYEQRRIANVLCLQDDKIELNRRMNATLEKMAQAIFRDWFIDFGPVRRKMAGETDPVAILSGLILDPARAAELAALFPDTLGSDGLPVEWEMAPLENTLVLQRGFDLPKSTRTDGHYPVIASSGPSGTHNAFMVLGPGVCTGRSGILGNVYFVNDDFWPLNTSLWIKSFPNATPLYAYHVLREIDLNAFNAGSAVPTLNRNHIHGLPVVKPPMSIIDSFDELGMLCYSKMQANDAENQTLAETRDYLLPRLMSGKVRVADAERLNAEKEVG